MVIPRAMSPVVVADCKKILLTLRHLKKLGLTPTAMMTIRIKDTR